MIQSRPWFGVALAMLVAAAFAGGSALAGLAFRHGTDALTVTTLRTLLASAVLFGFLRLTDRPWRLPPDARRVALALGTLVAFYSWALYRAVELMPVALAVLVLYLYPLLTGALSWVLGRETFAWRTAGALAIAFVGLTLALDLRGGNVSPYGVLASVGAALGFTAQLLLTSKLMATNAPQPVTLHMLVSAAVIYVVIDLALGHFTLPTDGIGWVAMIAATCCYVVAAIGLYTVIALLGPVKTGLCLNGEPIFSMLFGFLLLGQTLTPIQLVGAAIVVGAITLGRAPRPAAARAADGA